MKQIVVITGGAGFIGSNFLNKYVLLNKNIDFINVDILTYAGKLDNISKEVQKSENYYFEKADIRDKKQLTEIYKKYKPTDIIHFAAESHVDTSIENPIIFTETNIIGTQNLLDVHREFGLNRFHHISTDEVYGDLPDGGFFTETTPLNPSNPYSASKAGSDFLVKSYGRTFGLNYVITRSSNNFGPFQDNEKLIPRFIDLLKKNKKVTVHGDGSNIRDWIYVEDNCDAIWDVFHKSKSSGVYNIGGNNEYSNLEITKKILGKMGKDESCIEYIEDRLGNDKRYAIDATLMKQDFGWKQKIGFEEGMKKTLHFYLLQKDV